MRKKYRPNLYEEQYKALLTAVCEEQKRLIGAVETIIRKQGVIALYPEGPDKNTAIQDCEKAKHKMICTIGAYDARRQEAIEYFKQNFEHLDGWADGTNKATSHAIIENTYYNFYKK